MRVLAVAGFILLVGCATAARATLLDRFQAIGLPKEMAVCMVDDLDERLDDRDMQDLARYTVGLARADTPNAAVTQLMNIDNPRAVAAVGRSAFSCITGFGR